MMIYLLMSPLAACMVFVHAWRYYGVESAFMSSVGVLGFCFVVLPVSPPLSSPFPLPPFPFPLFYRPHHALPL